MLEQIEIERTFLLKGLPEDLLASPYTEITDTYFPTTEEMPKLRLRKKGQKYEFTKKIQLTEDASEHEELTVPLTEEEYNGLVRASGKNVRKLRYYYKCGDKIAEVDIFQDTLAGLGLVEFEFSSPKEKNEFIPPTFCLVDITQERFIAGGYLAGKSYVDIEPKLLKYGYIKINQNPS